MKRRLRAWVHNGGMLVLGLGLLAWFLWQANLKEVGNSLRQINGGIVALTIVGQMVMPVLRGRRFASVYGIRGRNTELAGLMGQFGLMSELMPARTGEIAFLVLLKHQRIVANITEAIPRWMLLRLCDFGAILLLAVVTAMWVPSFAVLGDWIVWARIALVTLTLVGVFCIIALRRLSIDDDTTIPSGRLRQSIYWLRRGLLGLHSMRLLAVSMGWSLAIWTVGTGILAIQFIAFSSELNPGACWVIAVGIRGISIFPIHAPLGIGTMHAATVGILHAMGMSGSAALGIAVAAHAVMVASWALQAAVGTLVVAMMGRQADTRATTTSTRKSVKELL